MGTTKKGVCIVCGNVAKRRLCSLHRDIVRREKNVVRKNRGDSGTVYKPKTKGGKDLLME